jgi:integrase
MTGTTVRALHLPPRRVGVDEPTWSWPVDLTRYDRSPEFTSAEREALASLGEDLRWWGRQPHTSWSALARVVEPLADARAALETSTKHAEVSADAAVAELVRCSALEGRLYWAWSSTTWLRVLGADQPSFIAAHPGWVDRQARAYLMAIAYLLRCVTDLRVCGRYKRATVAGHVFGLSRVQAVLQRVESVLERWGYSAKQHITGRPIIRVVYELLLHNGSPRLADLNAAIFDQLRADADPAVHAMLFQVQRALAALGTLEPPEPPSPAGPPLDGVPSNWSLWVQRWEATSTLAFSTRRESRGVLLKIGRWLASEHPEAVEPANWTREVCAAYVAAVDRFQVGAYTGCQNAIQERLGQPISAATKQAYLCVSRQFFRDGQEWGWFPRRFDPGRALATPRSIKAMIGPRPRVIDDAAWAKLLWAGLHLETTDVPASRGVRFYPVELVRALALTWLFGGLRSDEIARLRVGCIRWQPMGAASAADTNEVVCFLDVPVHKTGTPFTKPVDPLLGRAIAAWEAVRPEQPLLADPRTGELAPLLFAVRAKRVAKTYLNLALISALCRKAGVPETDARGRITSHRARSTIATQLYNAKEPMTLFELQAWLGHRSPQSTQHYARITPTTLAKAYSDAGYFGRNVRTIEVLLDREAVQSGAVANGTPWQYFDLGHGYCTFSFFEQCLHRMACARCDFYVPKDSTRAQLLEARDHLQRMLLAIPLTDDERAAVEDGAAAVEQLLTRLVDTPTPAGPTPRQLSDRTFIPLSQLTLSTKA